MMRRAPLPLPFFRECKTFAEDTFQNFLSSSLTLKVLDFNQMYFVVVVVKMLFQFAFCPTIVSRMDRNGSARRSSKSCLSIRLVISIFFAIFNLCKSFL